LFQNSLRTSEGENQQKNFFLNKQRERIQDVVEVVSSNTFALIQQVSEDNLKEFLVSILCLCIQLKQSIDYFHKNESQIKKQESNRISMDAFKGSLSA
jgi:hypothetical protein